MLRPVESSMSPCMLSMLRPVESKWTNPLDHTDSHPASAPVSRPNMQGHPACLDEITLESPS